MPRPVHFEITAKDPEKLSAFYRSVFDWHVNKWDGPVDYWLVGTGEDGTRGIDGAFMRESEGFRGTINTIDVADLDVSISKVRANGGQMLGEPQMIPGIGRFVYCKDVEGNLFGMMQEAKQP